MPHPVEQLMNTLFPEQLPGPVKECTYIHVIEKIDTYLIKNEIPIDHLPALLVTWRKELPCELLEYNQETVNNILLLLSIILQDDSSVSNLEKHLISRKAGTVSTILGWMGIRAKKSVPNLLWAIADNQSSAMSAKRALSRIGIDRNELLSYFRQLLDREVHIGEMYCGEAFANLGFLVVDLGYDDDQEFINILLQAARHNNPLFRTAVIEVINEIIQGSYEKLSPIIELLRSDSNEQIRLAAQKIIDYMNS